MARKPKPLARRPLVLESQPQVVVYLLEDDLVPKRVLVKVPLELVGAPVLVGEGKPQRAPVFAFHQDDGFASRGLRSFRDFVVGVVGEQREVAVLSACAQSSVAGQEHPVVGVAHDAHEERTHPVDRVDFVVRLAVEGDFLAGHVGVGRVERLKPEMDGFGVVRSTHFWGVVIVQCPRNQFVSK